MKTRSKLLLAACTLTVAGLAAVWIIGGSLMAPRQVHIGDPPNDLPAKAVAFPSKSGSQLRGWWLPRKPGKGAVVLLHGVRSNRLGMLGRARFLHREGFGVLLFDFQAHGESIGNHITFGRLESMDAAAAVEFLKSKAPGEKIGVVGASLGGAAALLADPSLKVDAMVLESVYPTIRQAVEDRLAIRFGPAGKWLAPLLTCQLRPRLGFGTDALRPIVSARSVTVPKLFIAGTADQETTEAESRELFAQAAAPKELWLIEGAGHVDLHAFTPEDYERRILGFLVPLLGSTEAANPKSRSSDWNRSHRIVATIHGAGPVPANSLLGSASHEAPDGQEDD